MSRREARARKRNAIFQKLVAIFNQKRDRPEELEALLRQLEPGEVSLWAVVMAAGVGAVSVAGAGGSVEPVGVRGEGGGKGGSGHAL